MNTTNHHTGLAARLRSCVAVGTTLAVTATAACSAETDNDQHVPTTPPLVTNSVTATSVSFPPTTQAPTFPTVATAQTYLGRAGIGSLQTRR